jgi:hypothetical protein
MADLRPGANGENVDFLLPSRMIGNESLLAEPARCRQRDLRRSRKAHIEEKCVRRDSTSTLAFNVESISIITCEHNFTPAR